MNTGARHKGNSGSRRIRRFAAFALVLALLTAVLPAVEAANALVDNPSPYLAMHGQDPVNWQEWGPAALQEARASGRPLFISSGYFSCHWCHVMQRESYQNPDIAVLLNRHFVPVKLDRELHPALDAYLIGFVERTSGQAGWPLNLFLTPEGYPLVGLTYAPPQEFAALLQRVSQTWSERRDELEDLARRGAEELAASKDPRASAALQLPSPEQLASGLRRQALLIGDPLAGGFGNQAKFPMAPTLAALLALQERAPDPELGALLCTTFDAMADKGLRDHLVGGFFRYTVDPDWQTPHFEKMLYTQALLVPLFLRASQVLDHPDYRDVARATLDFLARGMVGSNGAYISSLSAVDAEGTEGGCYLWRSTDLAHLLEDDERRLVARVWGLDGAAQHDAGSLPIRREEIGLAAQELGVRLDEAARLLGEAESKLIAARSDCDLPRDEKQLAGWNGLVLSAFVAGLRELGTDAYRPAARRLRDYLVERLWDGERLHRAVSETGWLGEATLEDYAFVAQGLADWGRYAGAEQDLALSRKLVRQAWERFYQEGGWKLASEYLLPAVPLEQAFAESPLPSPAAVLIAVTLDGDDPSLIARARKALELGLPTVVANPFAFAGQALLSIDQPPR